MGIAGTKEWDKSEVRKCPSCTIAQDTCGHVLFCDHVGRVETLKHTIDLMESWLEDADTDPDLLDCITEYAHGRGGRSMLEICTGLGEEYAIMARGMKLDGGVYGGHDKSPNETNLAEAPRALWHKGEPHPLG